MAPDIYSVSPNRCLFPVCYPIFLFIHSCSESLCTTDERIGPLLVTQGAGGRIKYRLAAGIRADSDPYCNHISLLFSFHFFLKCCDRDTLNTLKMFEVAKMEISGGDKVCVCFQVIGNKHVVGRILGDAVGTVETFIDFWRW